MNIYHYTSGSSLLNILSTSSLWATDISFLNDSKELSEGLTIVSEFGYERWIQFKNDETHPFHIWYKMVELITNQTIDYSKENNINVISFTTEGDYIRQWMAYCQNNSGYCIEFDREKLAESILDETHKTRLLKVDYHNPIEFKSAKGTIIQNIQGALSELTAMQIADFYINLPEENRLKLPPLPEHAQEIINLNLTQNEFVELYINKTNNYKTEALFRASTIKPFEFADEREFRIVRIIDKIHDANSIQHRERNGLIIPFSSISFNLSAIKRIIIGPCMYKDLAEKGLRSLLRKLELNDSIEINHSTCSLRPF